MEESWVVGCPCTGNLILHNIVNNVCFMTTSSGAVGHVYVFTLNICYGVDLHVLAIVHIPLVVYKL